MMIRVISDIALRRYVARRRPRRIASIVTALGAPPIIDLRNLDMNRACFTPTAVVTMSTPARAKADDVAPDHEDSGHESATPAATATSNDDVPTIP